MKDSLAKRLDELGDWHATFPGKDAQTVCKLWGECGKQLAAEKAARLKAEAVCAEMRELLVVVRQQVLPGLGLPSKYVVWFAHALSSDVGTGFLSPEDHKAKIDELAAVIAIPREHELTGPKPDCACSSCNLHHVYQHKFKKWLSPEVAAKVREVLGVENEWPVHDVLEQLALAAEHLLKDHDCDTHGPEHYAWCLKLAKQYIPQIKEALALLDKEGAR